MNYKIFCKKHTLLLPVIIAGFLASGVAQAQFNKYKSKTNYADKPKTSIKKLLNNKSSSGGKTDSFGRAQAVINKKSKSSKYVNLNPETAFGPEVVTSFDFPNTDIKEMVNHMQKLTGINFIYDGKLKGKVNISAPTPITVGDAWKAFETALAMNGYYLVESGAFYRIVGQKDIKYTKTKIYTGNYTPDTDRFVMRIIPLKNINAKQVERAFRPFNSRQGRIYTIEQTNTIIIQDTGSNINRLAKLVKFIDVPGHEESLQIVKVENSSAQEIVAILDKIIGQKTRSSSKLRSTKSTNTASIGKLTAEPRTNSIIAMTNAVGAKQLRALIKRLDVKMVSSSSGKIHVYYLNHGDSETLAKTLTGLVSGSSTAKTSRFTKRSSSSNSGNALFTNEVKITADKENNALVVTASPTDYLILQNVIDKLDIARDQVYVEGMIMETTVSDGSGYGISILGAYGTGNTQRVGMNSSGDLISMIMGTAVPLGGFFTGAGFGKSIEQTMADGSTQKISSVNALITAVATNSSTNVLATPQIMTMDNTEGIFEVGEQIPIAKKTDAANGSSTTSIEQQKVTMTLKITPQINKVSRSIKMKIDQKLQDFSSRKLPDGVASQGVATVTRSIVTHVTSRDKETIAMGGLMRDKIIETESKVPLLGDIPVLGWLFKHKSASTEKMNLLFFLTPRIVASKDKTSAKNVKDLLNRRAKHLQEVDEDPFRSTVKGLYEKAKRDEESSDNELNEFQRNNKQNQEEDDIELSRSLPNYKNIYQKIKTKKSSRKRK